MVNLIQKVKFKNNAGGQQSEQQKETLKWDNLYGLVIFALVIFIVVQLSPTLRDGLTNLFNTVFQSLQNIFNFRF